MPHVYFLKGTKNCIKCSYIDPPYNKGYDGFLYKDNYKHSSWLSMIETIFSSFIPPQYLLNQYGVFSVSIDDE